MVKPAADIPIPCGPGLGTGSSGTFHLPGAFIAKLELSNKIAWWVRLKAHSKWKQNLCELNVSIPTRCSRTQIPCSAACRLCTAGCLGVQHSASGAVEGLHLFS